MRAGCRSLLPTLVLTLAACTGGGTDGAPVGADRPALASVDVVVSPANLLMAAGATARFSAVVTGVADTSVRWSVAEGSAGGSIDSAGAYVAPTIAGTYHVIATSHADSSRTATAAVTVSADAPTPSATVTIAPTAIVLAAGSQQAFTCAVSGAAGGCTLSVLEVGGGTVDRDGVYTAPQVTGTFHVSAASQADPTRTATASVIVTAQPSAQAVAIAIAPASVGLVAGTTQEFTCTVTGSSDTGCSFSVQEGAPGGVIDASGRYTAASSPGTVHVVATSRADPTKTATAIVTLTAAPSTPTLPDSPAGPTAPPVTASISPASVSLSTGGAQSFTCGITGSSDTACTWSVQEGSAGGSVDSSGRYTAPGAAGTYHVIATSHADATKRATATVTVSAPPPSISVAITPASVSVLACQNVTLTATVSGSSNQAVTWSILEGGAAGAVSAQGVLTAPATAGTYHVIATSAADPTKTASAAIVVTEKVLAVTVSPANVSVQAGQTVQFTAMVTTSCGTFASSTTVTP